MGTILEVLRDFGRYFNPRKKRGLFNIALVAILIVVGSSFLPKNDEVVTAEPEATVVVTVASASALNSNTTFEVIGSVESVNRSEIKTEIGGRVTSVNVALGNTITANTTIATLENASQLAALLQAEGAYEAAQAAAANSGVGLESAQTQLLSAKNAAITSYQNAYTATAEVVYNSLDTIYANTEAALPGVRIDGGNQTSYLNNTRVQLRSTLPAWRNDTLTISPNGDLTGALLSGEQNIQVVLNLVDVVIQRLTVDADKYATTEFANLRNTLLTERSSLTAARSALTTARSNLVSAEESLAQAQISGSSDEPSASSAQLKQALGSLRAAQANYAKTIIRTPISGVVNVVDVKVGDFVSAQQLVATVANNNALEITAFVGQADMDRLVIGQTVRIDSVADGFISTIAPAINPETRKFEIKIQSESAELINGDTVVVEILTNESASETNVVTKIMLPITAVKFSAADGVVFTVSEDEKLEATPVTIGAIEGSLVEITSGITASTNFVIDARGLNAGMSVTVNQQ